MDKVYGRLNIRSGSFITGCIFACAVLVAGGRLYSKYEVMWQGPAAVSIELPVPLKEFPLEFNGWQCQEAPIPATTESYMRQNFADDFISRRYINIAKQTWANLYIVYCASRPASILGHRPRVCYKGSGWIHDSTEISQITSQMGRKISCLIHRFHKSPPHYQEIVVLSFYIANGRPTVDEDSFLKMLGRRFNTERDFRRYVSQIQISSGTESHVRQAAEDLMDEIFDFLPDTQ